MTARRSAKLFAAAALAAAGVAFAVPAAASAAAPATNHSGEPRFAVRVILNGAKLRHTFLPVGSTKRATEPLADPDDITVLGHHLFSGFQNGVGPQGQASPDGNTDSTIVEYTAGGHVVRQWDIKGKCDGVTADTAAHLLIATVNEDAHSSIYTITPGARPGHQIVHYRYNEPLPDFGGTDAISIYHHLVLVSASAPGTTGKAAPQPTYPAAYVVTFNRHTRVATVHALFYDEATARVANVGATFGKKVKLALTDPDSNEIVPGAGPRFAGDFMLTSQGDEEQIFAARLGRARQPSVGAQADPLGRRHGLGAEPVRQAVRRQHQPGRGRGGDRLVPGRVDLGSGHPLRREQRTGDLPGAWLPAELPRHAEPADRAPHQSPAQRAVVPAARDGIHQPRLGGDDGLTPAPPEPAPPGRPLAGRPGAAACKSGRAEKRRRAYQAARPVHSSA